MKYFESIRNLAFSKSLVEVVDSSPSVDIEERNRAYNGGGRTKDKAYSYDVKTIEIKPGILAKTSEPAATRSHDSTSTNGCVQLNRVEDYNAERY